ncbi:MAG TPA: conjugal transfer protein [Nakamurella sp.]
MVGRPRSWVTRLLLIAGPLLLAGGVAYSCGVSTGSSRLVQQASISSQDAAAFHLSSFPAARASAFGVAYLALCWTHPAPTDATATKDRLAALAEMTSAGVAPGCGWTGSTPSPAPLTVIWDGTATPLPDTYSDGAAAQMGFVVTTADRRTVGVTVPIWVPSPNSPTTGVRVVGDIAVVPVATAAPAPTPVAPAVTDTMIAESLTRSVIMPFLQAWSASDPVQLNLVLARDASSRARTGMDGQLSQPKVNGLRVIVTRGDPAAYRDGDRLTAQVSVDWTTRTTGVQRSGYSISLGMSAGRWQVVNITGSAPDPAGGASPSTTFAAPSSTTPPAG